MELRNLIRDDDAVAPVIGVILVVAITVILAAVIASFVLGLGQNELNQTPQTSIAFDYTEDSNAGTNLNPQVNNADGWLTINHDGGDGINEKELYIRGEFDSDAKAGSWADAEDNNLQGFTQVTTSGSDGDESHVISSDQAKVAVGSSYEVDVVFEAEKGSDSATLQSDSGPDA